eukprot:CAMPEP_0202456556 /NCGR_PEP_ID=MMETSP1360-20130828/13781_1 /ASSEMBLY_ACC=CAM_ASM_000848 /TAXON_ID=515479 /ORGANISM="Licmophora paradoxa, Strain CCMP2313" /LENGTH=233 /DNA_ID=CAMNT_0049076389 /DNA_START=460 /DNA_END=1162 /DNA_ORIENTATION=+
MKFKLVYDIDGNSWSERMTRLLCYNSAVIKVLLEPQHQQFDYIFQDLIPGVHYIPSDLNNFTQVALQLLDKHHDQYLQSIVQNANAWCRQHMTEERLNQIFLSTLEGYLSLLEQGWETKFRAVQKEYLEGKLAKEGFTDEFKVVNDDVDQSKLEELPCSIESKPTWYSTLILHNIEYLALLPCATTCWWNTMPVTRLPLRVPWSRVWNTSTKLLNVGNLPFDTSRAIEINDKL